MPPKENKNILTRDYVASSEVEKHKGSNVDFPSDAIKINRNNLLANLDNVNIPGSLYEPMVTFLKEHPIGYPLSLNPEKLYHAYLCEFWYTASVQSDDSIIFTLKNGSFKRTLNLEIFREVLRLNYLGPGESFSTLPKTTITREMLLEIGYKKKLTYDDGSIITSGTVQITHLTPTWKLFFTHIVECLGGASGGLDQMNTVHMEIAYALWKGLKIDFAEKIYKNLISKLKGKRAPFVLYIRFLSGVFRHFLQEQYHDAHLDFSHPDVTKDFSSTPPFLTEVHISDEMLRYVPLAKRYKTVAATPAGTESTSGGPQKNEGPTGRASGHLKILIPQSSAQSPISLNESSTTSSEDLPKDLSEYPKGKRSLKRLRKLSDKPTDSSAEAQPSGPSKQGPDMSKGNPQTSPSGSSLGRGGEEKEHGSSQAILVSGSSQAHISQISDTTMAPTDEVTENPHSVTEVAHSAPGDVSVIDPTETEGPSEDPHVTGDDVSTETEHPAGQTGGNIRLDQASLDKGIFLSKALEEEDAIELSSSNSSQDADDLTILEEGNPEYPKPTSSQVIIPTTISPISHQTTLSPMPPPPYISSIATTSQIPPKSLFSFSPLSTKDISDIRRGESEATPSSSFQIPTVLPASRMLASDATPESPPETLDARVEAQTTEVNDLKLKVIDLKNSLEDLRETVSRSQHGVVHEVKLFTNNEHAVFKKLNELVETSNRLAQAVRSSYTSVQTQVSASVSSSLDSTSSKLQKEMAENTKQIAELVKPAFEMAESTKKMVELVKPSFTKEELVKEVTTEVCKAFNEEMIQKVVSGVVASLPSGIDAQLNDFKSQLNTLNTAVTDLSSEIKSHTEKVSGVTTMIQNIPHPTPEPSFSAADRVLLEEISKGNSTHSYALNRLKNALAVFGRSLLKSVETSDWGMFKTAVDNIADLNLEDLSKGEELPKGVSPMIASVAEVLEATRPSEPQNEGTSGSHAQTEGETRLEGEQGKKKGKGKEVESGSEKVCEEDQHVDVPEDLHKQLKQAQLELTRKQRELEYHEKIKNDHLLEWGVKDTLDASALGVKIDSFHLIKSDPDVVQALVILEDVRKRLRILEAEEKLHATSVGVSVDVLRELKEKEKQKDMAEIQRLVKNALIRFNAKQKAQRTVRFRTPKDAAEARTDTFLEPTDAKNVSDTERSLIIPPVDVAQMNAESIQKYYQTRKSYEDMMKKRTGKAKITKCFIKINPDQKSFFVDLEREDGSRTKMDKALVFHFGFYEWLEMKEVLLRKGPSKHENAWIKAINKKIEIKEALEVDLGIRKPSTAEGSSSGQKRKATESSSSQSAKRSR